MSKSIVDQVLSIAKNPKSRRAKLITYKKKENPNTFTEPVNLFFCSFLKFTTYVTNTEDRNKNNNIITIETINKKKLALITTKKLERSNPNVNKGSAKNPIKKICTIKNKQKSKKDQNKTKGWTKTSFTEENKS